MAAWPDTYPDFAGVEPPRTARTCPLRVVTVALPARARRP